jgi:hypothetical protein
VRVRDKEILVWFWNFFALRIVKLGVGGFGKAEVFFLCEKLLM